MRKHNIDRRRGRHGDGYYLDFTVHGRRIRAWGGKTLTEAKLELGRLRAEKTAERPRSKDSTLTLATFGREFMEDYSKPNKRSWKRDALSLKSLVSFFGEKEIGKIWPQEIERFKARRSSEVSPGTVNRELACLKTMFNKAVEWGWLEKSPAAHVHKLKEPPPRDRILTAEETARLLDAAGPRLRPLIVLLLGTGMRRGEALALRWGDVRFEDRLIHIADSKSGKSRNIPLSSPVREVLADLPQTSLFVFNGVKDVKTAWKTARREAGLDNVRLHDLRHTAASRMIAAGVDIVTVSKILGHSTITMTLRYCHSTPENLQRAVNTLGEALQLDRSSRQIPS
jgi:integrase